MQQHKLIQGEC